jgi:hypothetical protein
MEGRPAGTAKAAFSDVVQRLHSDFPRHIALQNNLRKPPAKVGKTLVSRWAVNPIGKVVFFARPDDNFQRTFKLSIGSTASLALLVLGGNAATGNGVRQVCVYRAVSARSADLQSISICPSLRNLRKFSGPRLWSKTQPQRLAAHCGWCFALLRTQPRSVLVAAAPRGVVWLLQTGLASTVQPSNAPTRHPPFTFFTFSHRPVFADVRTASVT